MPEYNWPEEGKRSLIGKRHKRLDGPVKVSGKAKYTHDINRPNMLIAKSYRCPYPHARVSSIDITEAQAMPGVKAVKILRQVGNEILNALEDVVVVAAETEDQADDAVRKVKVKFERLPHLANERDLAKAGDRARPTDPRTSGDTDAAFKEAGVISEGYYGISFISHSTLEPHGGVAEWKDGQLTEWISTQAVTGTAGELTKALGVQSSNVETICNYVGGAFGSKLSAGAWGAEAARLAKESGRPVKFMLERRAEQFIPGGRPSDFARIRVAAKNDGTIIGFEADVWGTGGPTSAGGPRPPLPYVFTKIPNTKVRFTGVVVNTGPSTAWRAPNHPQACFLTMAAIDDCAAKLNIDPLDVFLRNLNLVQGGRPEDYKAELQKAAEMIEWRKNWHPRGDKTPGPIKRGLGLSIHTWGGAGHACSCEVKVHPDGSVEVTAATQDLGTGTRTIIAETAAETFGLPISAVKLNIGDSKYPPGNSSGGSTTVGGVSAATRRGAQDVLQQLFEKVSPALGVTPDKLEAVNGKIQVVGNPAKALTWKQACAKIGANPIAVTGRHGPQAPGKLTDANVGGAQMADVSVDIETGIVTINKFVAVQDCGLILNLTTAESQVRGAVIMGITYSLFEERIMDDATGRMLNPDLEFYKLAGIGDIGTLEVHMMQGKGFDERGVIGLGEPPVISPGAAISNAVANAIGVRVPELPMTPERVLAALEKGGVA